MVVINQLIARGPHLVRSRLSCPISFFGIFDPALEQKTLSHSVQKSQHNKPGAPNRQKAEKQKPFSPAGAAIFARAPVRLPKHFELLTFSFGPFRSSESVQTQSLVKSRQLEQLYITQL